MWIWAEDIVHLWWIWWWSLIKSDRSLIKLLLLLDLVEFLILHLGVLLRGFLLILQLLRGLLLVLELLLLVLNWHLLLLWRYKIILDFEGIIHLCRRWKGKYITLALFDHNIILIRKNNLLLLLLWLYWFIEVLIVWVHLCSYCG